MPRLSSLPTALQQAIRQGRALKVIAGLNNFDAARVQQVVRAAAAGGADLVDLACEPALVRLARALAPQLPICV